MDQQMNGNFAMEVHFTSHFARDFRKLSVEMQKMTTERKHVFEQNPHDPSLHTHKLQGGLQECWSFSVTRAIRILFYFESEQCAVFLKIGSRDDVY